MDLTQNPHNVDRRVFIKRIIINDKAIIGELQILDRNNSVIYSCYTLENDSVGKEANQDLAIPEGLYLCAWHENSKYTKTLQDLVKDNTVYPLNLFNDDVPVDRRILIHWGNKEEDTLGCILLGKSIGENQTTILQSKQACKEFYKVIGEYSDLDINVFIYSER